MQVAFAVLADYVNNTPDNKLNILGIFNQVNGRQFPAVVHDMRIVAKFQFTAAESGAARVVTIRLLGPDGQDILTFSQPMQVPNALNPEVTHIANLMGIPLPTPGDYAFHILVDNDEKARVPLRVTQLPDVQEG